MTTSSLVIPRNCTLPEILDVSDGKVFRRSPDTYHPAYDEVLHQIGEDIRGLGHLKKVHISALAAWKRLNLSSRWARSLQELADRDLAEMSVTLFEERIPTQERVARFSSSGIPGFRSGTFAVASTVLSAWQPSEFGITDRRSRDALKSLACGCSDEIATYTRYLAHLHVIRDWAFDSTDELRAARHIDSVLFSFGPMLADKVNPRRS